METLDKIWKWLDGKKRNIGIILLFAAQLPHIAELVDPRYIDIAEYIGNFLLYTGAALAAGGVVHAVKKGVSDDKM